MLRTVQLYESEHSHNWLSTSHIGRGSTKIPPKANTNNNKKKKSMQTIKEENKFVLCASTKLGSIGKTVGSQRHELVQCLLD